MNRKILFDFDGVFADTINICVELVQTYNPNFTPEELKGFFMGNIFHSVRERAVVREPADFDFQTLFKPRLLAITPFAGADTFLQSLNRNDNIIISSTRSDSIREFLQLNNISKYFEDILGCDVEKSKKVKFQKVKDSFPDNEFVFVTDTVGDILEGENFNMRTIAVTWGYHDRETLQQATPDVLVDTYDELLRAINNSDNK
jgi:phosphoglycolate phosphatase